MKEDGTIESKEDLKEKEEWETTRRLYAQLYLLSTMQNLLLARLEKRFLDHGVKMKQDSKRKFTLAIKCIGDAKKWIDACEMDGSRMGYNGDADFVDMNTALNREGYFQIRCILATQNAMQYLKWKDAEQIVDLLNDLTTGKKRAFSKKMIDTFRLEEDKTK